MSSDWVENRPPSGFTRNFSWREVWRHRELAFFLALRQVKLRYKQTAFGVAWAVMQPLAGMGVLTVVFQRVDVDPPGTAVPYSIFVLTGFIAWSYASNSAAAAAQSLIEDRELITKVYFPRILAPASAVLPPLVDLAVSLLVAAVVMVIVDVAPGSALLLLPAAIAFLVLIAAGVGVWLSALNVAYRDVRHALAFLLQAWFLLSPVFYATSVVPEGAARTVLYANPLTGGIEVFRWTLGAGPAPQVELLISVGAAAAILATGVLYFARVQARFADIA